MKYKEGYRLLYEGIVGIVEKAWSNGEYTNYDLVSEIDEELTCTAREEQCILVSSNEEIDQTEGINLANLASKIIQNLGASLTDKYFRDGNH